MMMRTGITEMVNIIAGGQTGVAFDAIAIGTSSAAPANTQTQLTAETTTNGGARLSGASVTGIVTGTGNKTQRFTGTFIFTGTLALFELMVGNNATANTGVMLLRQTFAAVLNVVTNDNLSLQIDVVGSDEAAATDSIIHDIGLELQNRGTADDLDAAFAKLVANALGSGVGALAAAGTALGTEITANGLGRSSGTHTITTQSVNGFVDTVQISTQWSVTGTQAVNEAGMCNSTTNSAGQVWLRVLYAATLNLVNTDTFTQVIRLVNK